MARSKARTDRGRRKSSSWPVTYRVKRKRKAGRTLKAEPRAKPRATPKAKPRATPETAKQQGRPAGGGSKAELILPKILARINPTPEERKKAGKAVEEAKKLCERAAKNSSVLLCGSFAKDTFLTGIRDVDIFFVVKEGKAVETDGLADIRAAAKALGGKAVEKLFSHPYLTASFKGYNFDLVPAYGFVAGEETRSSVDRTPLHAEYVNSHLQDKEGARLLKAFCRGIGVYGADAKVEGFSGYLCELLVVKHGSFLSVLQAVGSLAHPLEFKDPVDESRNVASAVSAEALQMLKEAAAEFLARPAERFFFRRKLPAAPPKLAARKDLFIVYSEREAQTEDALYSKARSALEHISSVVREQDFALERASFAANPETKEVLLLFRFQKLELPRLKVVEGPPLTVRRDYMEAFVAKHGREKVYQENGRLYAKDERRIPTARAGLNLAGRAILPTFAIIESQKQLASVYRSMPEDGKAKAISFLTGKRSWQF